MTASVWPRMASSCAELPDHYSGELDDAYNQAHPASIKAIKLQLRLTKANLLQSAHGQSHHRNDDENIRWRLAIAQHRSHSNDDSHKCSKAHTRHVVTLSRNMMVEKLKGDKPCCRNNSFAQLECVLYITTD